MITTETIGVGTEENFKVLEHLLSAERIDYSVHHADEEYDPTPWNALVRAHPGRIDRVLRALDSRRIYYETTAWLPTT